MLPVTYSLDVELARMTGCIILVFSNQMTKIVEKGFSGLLVPYFKNL
jgi:hypothetical protein